MEAIPVVVPVPVRLDSGRRRLTIQFENDCMTFRKDAAMVDREVLDRGPATNRLASVLWKPSGATRFCSRQTWGRQVAYQSQFNDATNRAHGGIARIKSRLIADLDPDEWDLPPKPKWMRWATYNRYEARYDHYEAVLDYGCAALAAKLFAK
jgi:hypothetical protein